MNISIRDLELREQRARMRAAAILYREYIHPAKFEIYTRGRARFAELTGQAALWLARAREYRRHINALEASV